jgi:hypothetical protein
MLAGKPEWNRPLETPRSRKEDIKMDLRETGFESVDWIHLAYYRDQWWDLVNVVMNLQLPQKAGNFLTN